MQSPCVVFVLDSFWCLYFTHWHKSSSVKTKWVSVGLWCSHLHTRHRNNAAIWFIYRWAATPVRSEPEVEMTNTIRRQIHHPVCSDSNCPGSMSQWPCYKYKGCCFDRDDIGASHIHLSQTPPLFVMTHFQFRKRGPTEDEQCPTWEGDGLWEQVAVSVI